MDYTSLIIGTVLKVLLGAPTCNGVRSIELPREFVVYGSAKLIKTGATKIDNQGQFVMCLTDEDLYKQLRLLKRSMASLKTKKGDLQPTSLCGSC